MNENNTPTTSAKVPGTGFYQNAAPGSFGPNEWLDLLMACQDGRATCMRVMEIIEREFQFHCPPLDKMVDNFLGWPLPESVCSDLCVTERGYKFSRVGTNLLTATEARQMIEYILGKKPTP